MSNFFTMDGYGVYVWTSYGLSFAFVLGTAAHSWLKSRRTQKTHRPK